MSNANFITLFWRKFCHKYTHGVMMSNSLKISHKKIYIYNSINIYLSFRTNIVVRRHKSGHQSRSRHFCLLLFLLIIPNNISKRNFFEIQTYSILLFYNFFSLNNVNFINSNTPPSAWILIVISIFQGKNNQNTSKNATFSQEYVNKYHTIW